MSKAHFVRTFTAAGILFVWIMASCSNDEPCIEPTQAPVNIGFYQRIQGVEEDTSLTGFSLRGLMNADSMLYDSANNIGKIALPLSQIEDYSVFVLTFSIPYTYNVLDSVPVIDRIRLVFKPDTIPVLDTIRVIYVPTNDTLWADSLIKVPQIGYYPLNDTIQFNYQRHLTLISEACGFTHLFTIEKVQYTRNVIDSVLVNWPEITPFDEENVKILF